MEWTAVEWHEMDWGDKHMRRGKERTERAGRTASITSLSKQRAAPLDHISITGPSPLLLGKADVRMKWGWGDLEDVEAKTELPRKIKGC